MYNFKQIFKNQMLIGIETRQFCSMFTWSKKMPEMFKELFNIYKISMHTKRGNIEKKSAHHVHV